MKELSAAQLAVTAGPVTAPCYLIEIELDQPYYLSTRQQTVHEGQTFVPGSIKLGQISLEGASLAVDNRNDRHTAAAMDGDYMRKRVRIWWAYGDTLGVPYAEAGYWDEGYTDDPETLSAAPILCFDGIIYATPQVGDWMTIDARREPARLYPTERVRAPKANFVPRSGYTFTFDGGTYIVERSR
mgnify:CR=1 FL=1